MNQNINKTLPPFHPLKKNLKLHFKPCKTNLAWQQNLVVPGVDVSGVGVWAPETST